MKPARSIVNELIILSAMYIFALACTKLFMHFWFYGKDELDLWIDDQQLVFGLSEFSLFAFIGLIAAVYSIRFTFFKPHSIFKGVIALLFLLAVLACSMAYKPLYIQFRQLTAENNPPEQEIKLDSNGYPIYDHSYVTSPFDYWAERDQRIENELFWMQVVIFAVTVFVLVLLILTVVKRIKNQETRNDREETEHKKSRL